MGLGDQKGLGIFHRAQDLQSFLMHREAVRLLRANPALVHQLEDTLWRWREQDDAHSAPLRQHWMGLVARRDWDAALANTEFAQQLRQASPFAGLLPNETRLAIIRYVKGLKGAQ